MWPYYTLSGLIAFAVWTVIFLIWRYVSLASIFAAMVFPIALSVLIGLKPEWQIEKLWPLYVAAIGLPLLVIARHAENIKRLLEGSESKIGRKEKSA